MRPSLKADALCAMHVQDWIDNKIKHKEAVKGGQAGRAKGKQQAA